MSTLLSLVLPAVAAAALAFGLTPVVSRLAVMVGAIDMPGDRKIHSRPIPRLGGLAVVSAIVIAWCASPWLTGGQLLLPAGLAAALSLGLLPVLAISIVDDIRPLRAAPKLLAHLAGAIVAVAGGVALQPDVHLFDASIHLGALALPISVLWIVGVTNAFNIIDGLDGLSAGLALIAATSMAAVFVLVGQPAMAGLALVLSGALAGFLPYNLYPARLFLGDTGATAIGFCLAAFALKGGSTLTTGFAALLPVFIMGLPIADTMIAMARRALHRLETHTGGVFVADRNHIHHRLLSLGLDHGRAVFLLHGAGVVLAGAAFVSIFMNARQAALFVVALLFAGIVGVRRLGYDEFAFIRRGTVLKVYEVPVVKRSMFSVFVDIATVVFAAYVAVGLKADTWGPGAVRPLLFDLAGTFAPLTVLVFWKMGLYKGNWKRAGIDDLMQVCAAAIAVTILGYSAHTLWSLGAQPVNVFLVYGLVSLVCFTGLRASYVVLLASYARARNDGTPALIYGAGKSGVSALRELFENSDAQLRPVGFIDDDGSTHGRVVHGLPVLGGVHELERILERSGARALLLATSRIAPHRVRFATQICERAQVSLFRMYVQFERVLDQALALEPVPSLSAVASVAGEVLSEPRVRDARASVGPLVDAQTCPCCRSANTRRSHSRNLYERIRKARSMSRLYRCNDCGWRGWLVPLVVAQGEPVSRPLPPDLSGLDHFAAPLARGV
jgi:UDP-GlcNAc:undecaprenyl-phosphate GlcNAc-1-phosphate transferase